MTITKEGALASFYTTNKAPIKHLRVYFSPKQAGEGDPSPQNVRPISGWNKLSVGLNRIPLPEEYQEVTYIEALGQYANIVTDYYPNDSTNYYLKAVVRASGSASMYAYVFSSGGVFELYKPNGYYTFEYVKGNGLYRSAALTVNRYLEEHWITGRSIKRIASNGNTVNVNMSQYEPFQSTEPLILFGTNVDGEIKNYYSGSNLTSLYRFTLYENELCVRDYIPCYRKSDNEPGLYDIVNKTFWTKSGTDNFRVGPNVDTGYLACPNWLTIGEIPGGHVDLVTGDVWKNFELIDMDDLEWSLTNGRFYAPINDIQIGDDNSYMSTAKCDIYKTTTYNNLIRNGAVGIAVNNAAFIRVYDPDYTTIDDFITAITGHKLAYPLAEPVKVGTINPITLETLIGQNNIWSNADRVEVEYDLAESNDELYRRRNILLKSAPHIVIPTAANLHSFNTDMVAPLKECKVHFEPVQEGEGDPSPDNIRPISGWNELKLWASGKNILPDWKSIYVNRRQDGETFNGLTYSFTENGFQVTGTATASSRANLGGSGKESHFIANNSPILKGGHTYIISYNKTGSLLNDGSGQVQNRSGWIQPNTAFQLVNDGYAWLYHALTTEEGLTYNEKIENVQLELGSVATDYESYKGIMIPIDWSLIGEIPGGYVDLVNGEIVQEWGIVDLGICTWIKYNKKSDVFYTRYFNGKRITFDINTVLSSHYKYEYTYQVANMPDKTINDSQQLNIGNVTICDADYTEATVEEFKTAMSGIMCVYKLATPIHHTIDPVTLKTLRGLNNIWSSANGPIELSYWTH